MDVQQEVENNTEEQSPLESEENSGSNGHEIQKLQYVHSFAEGEVTPRRDPSDKFSENLDYDFSPQDQKFEERCEDEPLKLSLQEQSQNFNGQLILEKHIM